MPAPLNPDPATVTIVAPEHQCRETVPGSHARTCIRPAGHPGRHRANVRCAHCETRPARTLRSRGAEFAVGSPALCKRCARLLSSRRAWQR